jgi:hypothetical protein
MFAKTYLGPVELETVANFINAVAVVKREKAAAKAEKPAEAEAA